MSEAQLEATFEKAEESAKATLERECISPFKHLVGGTIPYIMVSSALIVKLYSTSLWSTDIFFIADVQYRKTLTDLVAITSEHVENYITEAGYLAAISQKINPSSKIHTSIE